MTQTRFPAHRANYPTLSPSDGLEYWPTAIRQSDKPFQTHAINRWKHQGKALAHPTRNGMNDPVSIALVVDLLLRLEHNHTTRSRDLAQLLSIHYPQITWDAITIGKILSSLAEVSGASAAPTDAPPIQKVARDGSSIFVIHPNLANWRWLGEVRHQLGEHAMKTIEGERQSGRRELRPDFPWEVVNSITWGKKPA